MTIVPAELEPLGAIEIAKIAARKAGAYLLQKLGAAKVERSKSLRDDLLDADLQAESLILTTLRGELPQIGILSEEAGYDGDANYYWIVDPLDGSANFQHASPIFGIAIALMDHQTAQASLIYLPARDEMFTAIRGQGAYLNDARIHVSEIDAVDKAIIHVGDFTKADNVETTNRRLEDFTSLARYARRIRMIGTAATDFAYLACGRADALINHATAPWDIEAGKLLLLEAGGEATTVQDHRDQPLSIYSNEHMHQIVKNILLNRERT